MIEGGKPLPPCNLNLVICLSSLASKCQDFKVGMSFYYPFYVMTLKTCKFKASEDIITKLKSQGLHIIIIKY